jgi:pimeloyl-ACP methyl ester carboxylesterase
VHGIVWDLDRDDYTWGYLTSDGAGRERWTGMIGALESKGLAYGGTIRPRDGRVRLPENLDVAGTRTEPRSARFFVLKFSSYANTDGLGYKAIELAEAIKQLCRFTGAEKVRLVGHSAGGLVARVYLQSALPGIEYRHDVDRLITIGTPHLGSALASHWGDFLGTRATSIKPESPLMRDLNGKFDLPLDTAFASIVVRGVATDSRSVGKELDGLVDHPFLGRLPIEYRIGGDEVVHVRSQNLRLAECAARYEERGGRPVQYILARVPDPSPDSHWPASLRVHIASASDPTVEALVAGLIRDDSLLWRPSRPEQLAAWRDWQARLHAGGLIEAQAIDDHPMSEVSHVKVEKFALTTAGNGAYRYAFAGKAFSENKIIPFRQRWTHVSSTLGLEFDEFGRVTLAGAGGQ